MASRLPNGSILIDTIGDPDTCAVIVGFTPGSGIMLAIAGDRDPVGVRFEEGEADRLATALLAASKIERGIVDVEPSA